MRTSGAHIPALLPSPSDPASPIRLSLNVKKKKKKKKKRCQVPQEEDEFGVQERGPTPGCGSRAWKPHRLSPGGDSAWAGGPGRRARGCRAVPLDTVPSSCHAARRAAPAPWLLNEPLSVWSLLVLAPSSLWNQAQIPGKANRDRFFEEKESESWNRETSLSIIDPVTR